MLLAWPLLTWAYRLASWHPFVWACRKKVCIALYQGHFARRKGCCAKSLSGNDSSLVSSGFTRCARSHKQVVLKGWRNNFMWIRGRVKQKERKSKRATGCSEAHINPEKQLPKHSQLNRYLADELFASNPIDSADLNPWKQYF